MLMSNWGPMLVRSDRVRLLEAEQVPVPVEHAQVVFSNGLRRDVGGNAHSDHVIYVGTGGSSMTCDVYWPSGYEMKNVSLSPGSVTTLYHRTGFDDALYIVDPPEASVKARPNCKVTYRFHWITPVQTNLSEDVVVFEQNTVLAAGWTT